MVHVLIPGAGGSAWFWHRVAPLLADAVAVELPAADDTADLSTYADVVCDMVRDEVADRGPVTVVAQSLGAMTAPLVADRLPTVTLILVNPMIPAPGEAPGQWWGNTGQKQAQVEHFDRIGLGRTEFDAVEDFFHDVPDEVRAEAVRQGEPAQSDRPFAAPWPLAAWPDVPTRVIAGRDDRLFPLKFQRRVARDRLGLDVEVTPGGHLSALSRPDDLAARLRG